MLDDDMKLEALPQTNNIKSIVTLEDKTDLERRGRQIVLTVKERKPDRKDDPFLGEKLIRGHIFMVPGGAAPPD